jgi:hypothetical protein
LASLVSAVRCTSVGGIVYDPLQKRTLTKGPPRRCQTVAHIGFQIRPSLSYPPWQHPHLSRHVLSLRERNRNSFHQTQRETILDAYRCSGRCRSSPSLADELGGNGSGREEMISTSPKLRSSELWRRREAKCLSIIERALRILLETTAFPESEIELNRKLHFCLLSASRELYPDDEIAPLLECNNQPDPDDESRAGRELKRPDFQWVYLDRYESDVLRSSKQFVLECKRLGTPPRADWVLNSNYVANGVDRFRAPEWAYGKLAPTGAMVGYVQSMQPDEILIEVNAICKGRSFPDLVIMRHWGAGNTGRFEHTFERSFEISPFNLHHFWIDLRRR